MTPGANLPKLVEDDYGATLECEPLIGSKGPRADLNFTGLDDLGRVDAWRDGTGFFRLPPAEAVSLAIELINSAQQVDPMDTRGALLYKFKEMAEEGRI